jgi:DNA-binding response OmpR family regulator
MNYKLLWVDDEIELLKAHILYLEKKGYVVETVTNGYDALDRCTEETFDLILLDENMPGLSGLETLSRIKEQTPNTPVVMVTKSEEENIMEQAIGAKIADYLIKPVNPTQILLTLKKNIQQKEIVTEHTQSNYQQDFSRLGMLINDASSIEEWTDVYKKLTYWELQLSETESRMQEMLGMQRSEANREFANDCLNKIN